MIRGWMIIQGLREILFVNFVYEVSQPASEWIEMRGNHVRDPVVCLFAVRQKRQLIKYLRAF